MQRRFPLSVAAILLATPVTLTVAHAAEAGGFCTSEQTLDKDQLAATLIRTYPVSTAYLSVGKEPAPLTSPRALVAWLLHKRAMEKSGGQPCQGDSCNVDHMAADVQSLLEGQDARFQPSGRSDVVAFFRDDSHVALRCKVADATPALAHADTALRMGLAAAPAPTPAAGPATPPVAAAAGAAQTQQGGWMDHVRIRGNPDQLSIDHRDKAAFASVDRARVALANDDVAQSRTNDVVVYAGYSLDKRPMGEPGSTYEAVPYVGFKQNRVINYDSGSAEVTTTRTSQVGMLSAFHFAHADTANTEDLTARPDYLVNNSDGSRLLTVNFTLTPVRPGVLNDFLRWNNGLAFKPILIGQSRNGIYINRGDPDVVDQHRDFIRLGAQAGFTLSSTNPALPFDFTTTFTGLKALQGSRSIHYWKSVLTYNFNQNVGLSLDYSNGLLPDSGDPERKWGLGVSSKF
ncbi:hypothetical protein HBDW_22140 [Herbaspirillum sp. DW155]|uniref:hypothetical protein n=1 Tax=Herbaspirillum sp. DW155 TaxID=3095609 RepID=UPI0030877EFD|nr:hypothetical protein HBDW_22140 [Herbaspirillum sp. DW155]